MRRALLAGLCGLILFLTPRLGGAEPRQIRVISRSGQIAVIGETALGTASAYKQDWQRGLRGLEPGPVAIASEKVRMAFLSLLLLPDEYQGRIELFLAPDLPPEHLTTVVSTRFTDGWQYRVQVSARSSELKVVRAITQCLLLEYANRGGAARLPEIPTWLCEGLTLEILRVLGPGFSVKPERAIAGAVLRMDSLMPLREFLSVHAPLSLEQLAGEVPPERETEKMQLYQASSQCLVHELLRLPEGQGRLALFLRTLPEFWNWQTAFLQAYQVHFPKMLAAEKWWSLASLNFPRDPGGPAADPHGFRQELESVLIVPGAVRIATNSLPSRAELNLQQIIRGASFETQRETLGIKITQLTILELRAPPGALKLVDDYRKTLEGYLSRRASSGLGPRGSAAAGEGLIVRDTIRKLNLLDRQREAMQQQRALTRVR